MPRRVRPAILLPVLGAVAIAACQPVAPPPPPPPPPALCQASAPPGPEDKVAFIRDDATGTPDVVTFEARTQAETNAEVAELDRTAEVISVERDRLVTSDDVVSSDDGLYAQQWGFTAPAVDFEPAWNVNVPPLDGNDVRVAVIDSGVQASHPDLNGNVLSGKDFIEPTGVASNNARIDGHGHGTHVAGTIAAKDNAEGVVGGAPHAQIVPVRVLNCTGSGTFGTVAAGILWASDPAQGNARVLNLSLGGENPGGPPTVLVNAVNDAQLRGAILVASAGNCGQGTGCSAKNAVQYPAALPDVIAVGALDEGTAVPFTTATDAADTPDSPENSLLNDIEVVAHVQAASWTPAAPQALVSKLDPTGGYEPLLLGTDGKLTFTGVDPLPTTLSAVSTVGVGEPAGTRIWLRVTRDAVGTVTFSKAPDADALPTSWTQIGSPVSMPGALADTAVPLTIGNDPGGAKPFTGAVLYAEVRGSVGGTVFRNVFDPSLQPLGQTTWISTSPTGETWTLHGPTVTYRSAPYSNTNSTVDVAAPGSKVISTYTGPDVYKELSGTSMSSPHVAALVALLIEKCPSATETWVLTALTANDTLVGGFANPVGLVKAGLTTTTPC